MTNTGFRVACAAAALLLAALLLAACQEKKPAPASSLSAGTNAAAKPKGKPYKLTVKPPAPGDVGSALVAAVELVPTNGYHVNLEYPTKLIVRAAAAATPEKTLTRKDAAVMTITRALFKPSVTLKSAGKQDVKAELKFSVCTKTLCELKHETLSWRAEARPGAAK